MGVLRHVSSGRSVVLPAHGVVGRAPSCAVRLADHAASNDHASVIWTGERWAVRDLGSTNGTSVDGNPVQLKESSTLLLGAIIRFGSDAERWELIDDCGPIVVARSVATGEARAAEDGLLALPGPDDVVVSIVLDSADGWFVETPDGGRHAAQDAERISVAGKTWELSVPPVSPVAGTYKANHSPALARLTLHFHVSRDEEHVRIQAFDGSIVLSLGQRACFYALLLLARTRREDAANANLSDAEQGWVYVEDLAKDLAVDERNVNVTVHRVREAFAKAGVEDAEGIIQRRPRQIRIGIGRLEETKS